MGACTIIKAAVSAVRGTEKCLIQFYTLDVQDGCSLSLVHFEWHCCATSDIPRAPAPRGRRRRRPSALVEGGQRNSHSALARYRSERLAFRLYHNSADIQWGPALVLEGLPLPLSDG